LKSCCVLQDHYDDERNKTVFHNTTPHAQDQDQNQDRFSWSETADVADRQTYTDTVLFTPLLIAAQTDNGRSLVCNAQKYPNSEGNVCTRHEPDVFSVSQQTSASDGSG